MNDSLHTIILKKETRLSKWLTLNEKHVSTATAIDINVYHSIRPNDYVTILAVRSDGLIPIVRQFRPAVEQYTLELPGGLVDSLQTPLQVAISEIHEETGHYVLNDPMLLGCIQTDTGRLENHLWAFIAGLSSDIDVSWAPEPGVEVILVSRQDLFEMVCNGKFNNALHLGVIALALTKGFFSW